MKSLKVDEGTKQQTYICAHWRSFPPIGAGASEGIETLRASKVITDEQYNHYLIWQRECGLLEMDAGKCLTCPHRRKVAWRTTGPVLVDPGGVETPVLDSTTGESAPRNRHMAGIFQRPGTRGSHQPAAWVLAKGSKDAGDV